jgi:hypothetical protein
LISHKKIVRGLPGRWNRLDLKGILTYLLKFGAECHKTVKEWRVRANEEKVFHRLFHRLVENGNGTAGS